LKIDRSFTAKLAPSNRSNGIVDAVIAVGRSLGLHVLAEGVETHEQAAYLAARACDEAQGFLLNKPMPSDQFLEVARSANSKITFDWLQNPTH
jgi:EAL domain-containing protein (putative c-di-GMP-specific phosphodiesterase class I)